MARRTGSAARGPRRRSPLVCSLWRAAVLGALALVAAPAGAQVYMSLPPPARQAAPPRPTLEVRVSASGEATVDGMPVDSLALRRAVRAHIVQEPQGAVFFATDRALPYGRYIEVLDTIKAAHAAERDLAARAKFKRPLRALSDEERAAVWRAVPLRISLQEPTADG